MNSEYKVYCVKNSIDGKIYIGATTKSIEERKKDHIAKSITGIGSYFQEAIGTYGPDAFQWEQIDTASSSQELAEKERYYIDLYDARNNGYNQDRGGGFSKTIYQFTDYGWLIGEWPSLSLAAFVVSGKITSISNACLGYCKTYKNFYWSYTPEFPGVEKLDLRKKKVVQYDLEGNEVATFNSVAEASKQTGLSKTSISRVCRGERQKACGFIWKYV